MNPVDTHTEASLASPVDSGTQTEAYPTYMLILSLPSAVSAENIVAQVAAVPEPSRLYSNVSWEHQQVILPFLQMQTDQSLAPITRFTQNAEYRRTSPLRTLVRRHHLLTDRTTALLKILWNIVLSKALQSGLRVSGAVDVEQDSEELTSQVVLRVYVQASAVQTLAFWDGLDNDLGRWLDRLEPGSREIVTDDIGLRLHWST